MKYLTVFILLLCTTIFAYSQVPQAFKYQAVLKNNSGGPLSDKTFPVRVSILSGSSNGPLVYMESHSGTTSNIGVLNLEIGRGNVQSGSFPGINWGQSSFYLKVEIDSDLNGVYEFAGTAQLLSVPYALYAENGDELWSKNNNDIYYLKGKVGIGLDAPQETLHLNGSIRGDQNGALRIETPSGYIDVGPKNGDYAHFYTQMPYGFYFNNPVSVREHLIGYRSSDLHISTQSIFTFQPVKRISILNSNGFIGIATDTPRTRLQVADGDIYISDVNNGVIMKSPNGQCWRMTVSNAGTPVMTLVGCP